MIFVEQIYMIFRYLLTLFRFISSFLTISYNFFFPNLFKNLL